MTVRADDRLASIFDDGGAPIVRVLVPASPAVPAATENNKHDNEDDQKCGVVHVASYGPCEYGLLVSWSATPIDVSQASASALKPGSINIDVYHQTSCR
jgi:hypothetical protein